MRRNPWKRIPKLRKRYVIECLSHARNSCRASTLVEVLLVIAGIGIMCGLLIPTVRNIPQFEDSNNSVVAVASNTHPN